MFLMKAQGIAALLLLAAATLSADETPSVDVFAGWSWYPFASRYPYCYPHHEGWLDSAGGPYPYVGLARTWPYSDCPWPYRYGIGAYPYGWGLGYGARLRVYPGSPLRLPEPGSPLLAPDPGTAPTSLRDEKRERAWDEDIRAFLSTLPTASDRLAATNAPAAR